MKTWQRVVLTLGATVVALAAAVAVVPPLVSSDRADYSKVEPIPATREYQDPALLARAWALPVASRYRAGFESQHNVSFCGPASLVDVMHSLNAGGDQSTVLDGTGTSTFLGFLPGGLGLDQVADIARVRLGKHVTVLRDLDLAAFREQMAMTNDPSRRYVINFMRGPLFAKCGGHHSPIGGYLSDLDLVFVLDVNSRYGPWLVNVPRLFEAMDTVDHGTGKKRGLLLVQ